MIPLLLLAQTPTSAQTFNAAIATSKGQSSVAAEITLQTSGRLGNSRRKYVIKGVRPSKAWVNMTSAGDKDTAASERIYSLNGSKIVAWDVKAREWLTRPVPAKYSTLYDGLLQGTGSLDEQARFLLDPPYFQKFLGLMRDSLRWTVAKQNGVTTLMSRNDKDINELKFDSAGRMVSMKSSAGLLATYRYLPLGTIGSTPPSAFAKVDVFRERAKPPRYASADAKRVIEASVSAHWRIKQAAYEATTEGSTFRVRYDRGKLRSDGGGWRVLLTSNSALVYSPTAKTAWAKKGSKTQILDFLKSRRVQVDGFALQLWKGVNPLQAAITPTSTVFARGSFSRDGGTVDVVEVKRDKVLTSLLIRRGDRMIAQIATEVDGNRAQRDIVWRSLNKALPSSDLTLSLPSGTKRL